MTDIFKLLRGNPEDSDYKKKGVIVQGITGAYGSLHAKNMMTYGTNVVAGVTPGKGGQKFEGKVPIYNTVKEAVDASGAKISIVFVPAKFFLGAAKEALEAGIKLLVAIPEHVPVRDTMEVLDLANKKGAVIIGPNTPGIMIPELIKIGIGGDPINGTRMIDAFDMVKDIPDLEGLVVVGEIGGDSEEILAQRIIDIGFKKPTVAYIAGRAAPKEKRMGHAGAIVMGTYGSAESKVSMFNKANIPVAKRPSQVPVLLAGKMQQSD